MRVGSFRLRRWHLVIILLLVGLGFCLSIVFSGRALAPLNWLAVVTAIWLGLAAHETASEQAAEARSQTVEARVQSREAIAQTEQARRSVQLSYQPLLVPVHDPASLRVRGEKAVEPCFPAEEPYQLRERGEFERVFRVVEAPDGESGTKQLEAIVFLKNVGPGPAYISQIRLWNGKGAVGALSGAMSVGPRESEAFVGTLSGANPGELARTASLWHVDDLIDRWNRTDSRRLYFLEVEYDDVFKEQNLRRTLAWFDPSGRGRWHILGSLAYGVD